MFIILCHSGKKIKWSDESKYELLNPKKRLGVWRKPNEALMKQYTLPTVKHVGGSIMVWGCFSWHGVGKIISIEGKMDANYYTIILSENLETASVQMGITDNYIFQQDNDPKHTAKRIKNFFEDSKIDDLEWSTFQ